VDRLRLEERFECWNRGEFDLMLEPYAEDAVFDISAVFTDVAPVRGHEAMRRCWHELRETWDGLRLEPVELLDVGNGRVVVDLRVWGRAGEAASRSINASPCSTRSARKTGRSPAATSLQESLRRSQRRDHPSLRLSE